MATKKSTLFSGNFKNWLAIAALVVIFDQMSKLVTLQVLKEGDSQVINSFTNWVLVYNSGAAFSFLANAGGWQKWFFIGISGSAALIMLWLLVRHSHQTIFCISISLVLGGAVGNLIDRFTHGAVVDFIDVFYGRYHWPAFNVADSAITIGGAFLILDELRRVIRHK